MRINIYSQELILGPDSEHIVLECSSQESNTRVKYSFVRMFLHSSDRLHHPPRDDDRSALTFWLPRSLERREALAKLFDAMAEMVRNAPKETGLD